VVSNTLSFQSLFSSSQQILSFPVSFISCLFPFWNSPAPTFSPFPSARTDALSYKYRELGCHDFLLSFRIPTIQPTCSRHFEVIVIAALALRSPFFSRFFLYLLPSIESPTGLFAFPPLFSSLRFLFFFL